MKIIIAGIGGVGGYFGGLLAKHFYGNENIQIYFIARGSHLQEIKKNGLTVLKGDTSFIAKPTLATNNPSEIGVADLVIICTKSYDLETMVAQLQPCINKHTIILPLLNGVDSKVRVKEMLPDNVVLDGCVYIVSRLKEPGVVVNSGNIQLLYFGLDNTENERLQMLEKLMKDANVEATYADNIATIIWEKFIFISPTATATSYYNNCIGELLANEEKLATVMKLVEEIKLVAKANQVNISEDITLKTLNRLKALNFEMTSSMHSDFKSHKPMNELESLTGYVAAEGLKHGLSLPTYNAMYEKLKTKNGILY